MRPTYEQGQVLEAHHHNEVRAISEALGPDWSVHIKPEYPRGGSLKRASDGMELSLWLDSYRGRVEVFPAAPQRDGKATSAKDWLPYGTEVPTMKFMPGRAATAVAREIERRVVVTFAPLWAQIKDAAEKHEAGKGNADQLAKDLAAIIGGRLNNRIAEGGGATIGLYDRVPGGYGDVTVRGYGSVDFHIRGVNADTARKIATFLASLTK